MSKKGETIVLPFVTSSIQCPKSQLTDDQLVKVIDPSTAKLKLIEMHYFERDSWLVAYVGKDNFANGSRMLIARYTSSGWVLVEPIANDYHTNTPKSVQKFLEEASANE